MSRTIIDVLKGIDVFFLLYLLFYATYLFFSVATGAWCLDRRERMQTIRNEIRHEYYLPVSILVPAHNEEVTIVDSIQSLLELDYRLYEIIVIDDGSTDATAQAILDHFPMHPVKRPIRMSIACNPAQEIYEAEGTRVPLTFIRKKGGGKGDALNLGINASQYPYFLSIDADSMLQRDSLRRIIQPVMGNDKVVAVGGLIRAAQCVHIEGGVVKDHHMPGNPWVGMQVLEYDRSFLASRILLDQFGGNLIISGAFGLFKKDIVVAVGGYDCGTLGEDMELVVHIHAFCRNNRIPYVVGFEPTAVCWSQVPGSLRDLSRQRRRWHLGLFQCLLKYRSMFMRSRYGAVGMLSYLYYLFYELLSPPIELLGWLVMAISAALGLLDVPFMVSFYALYALYGAILTMTAFFQSLHAQKLRISIPDTLKAIVLCVFESVFYRFALDFVRATAFIGYRKRKTKWGTLTRVRQGRASGEK